MLYGIDIFSGAGGLSLGAEMCGISVYAAIEKDPNAVKTYSYNHPITKVICDDIHNVNPKDIIHGGVDISIIFGGPPCQGFSSSNTKTRSTDNPENSLFEEFVRFVDVVAPRWFVFENVEGITNFDNGKTLQKIIHSFIQIGYTVEWTILVASDFGVPQHRSRFFLVGNRNGVHFQFPEPGNNKVTVDEAIADLPILANGQKDEELPYRKPIDDVSCYAKLMRGDCDFAMQNYVSHNSDYVIERYHFIKQGQNWEAIPDELMQNYSNKRNCHSGVYKRLYADEPSIVISNYRKNMLIHPYQDRGLSVREAARLQSFPDSFKFCGKLMSIQQQIGNAVPPLLAKAIFQKVLQYENEST